MDARKKPTIQEIKRLQAEYPRLDLLMCETILSFTDEELGKFIEEETQKEEVAE